MNPPPVIQARGLEKSYGQVHAVRGIDLEVTPGRCIGLLGPNGAGKTTTMRMIMGLTVPSGGELRVFGVHGMAVRHYDGMLRAIAGGAVRPGELVAKTIGLDEVGAELASMGRFAQEGVTVMVP